MTPEERLAQIAAIAHEFAEGLHDPEFHWEECPAGDEDGFKNYVHAIECGLGRTGQPVEMVVGAAPWPVLPELDCCDPDEVKDLVAMERACVCSVGKFAAIERLAAGGGA